MIYWDTSALMKVYNAAEDHHARAVNLKAAKVRHLSSIFVELELQGAICSRLFQNKRLMKAVLDKASEDLKDWTFLAVDPHLEPARVLCERHGLRGADALHLASALSLRREMTRKLRFVSADRHQLAAALAERLKVIDLS
jgi:predicted nucleic acid-binding protein